MFFFVLLDDHKRLTQSSKKLYLCNKERINEQTEVFVQVGGILKGLRICKRRTIRAN